MPGYYYPHIIIIINITTGATQMYQIKDVKIDWMINAANSPLINILFDDISDAPDDWEHERIAGPSPTSWVYIAQKYGMVHCHYYNEEERQGYGGRSFKVKMKDGTHHVIYGPWHGGAPNRYLPTIAPCIEVYHTGARDTSWNKWQPDLRTYPKTWGYMTYFGLYADIHGLNLWLNLNKRPWRIEKTEGQRYQGWDIRHLKYGFKPEDYSSSSDMRSNAYNWRKKILADPIERGNSHGA
jgi:hypothetical protein